MMRTVFVADPLSVTMFVAVAAVARLEIEAEYVALFPSTGAERAVTMSVLVRALIALGSI